LTAARRRVSYSGDKFSRGGAELPQVTINLDLSPQAAIDLAKQLAYDDKFRSDFAQDPVAKLADHGITIEGDELPIQPVLPPKHVIQEALMNITEASEFAGDRPYDQQLSIAYWLFVIFAAT
jgi:putative modified peptide